MTNRSFSKISQEKNNIPKAQSKQKADLTAEKCGDVDDDADEEDGDDVPGEA